MEKLFEAIANNLVVSRKLEDDQPTIQQCDVFIMQVFKYRDIEEKVKELFKKELINHLCTELYTKNVGEEIKYSFAILKAEFNDNFKEVLSKLPALNERENYAFPDDMEMTFVITEKNDNGTEIKTDKYVSEWIVKACK